MKIERTKNTIKNIKAGMFLRFYQMLVPFLMRTAMLYFMGIQYLGLNSLFTSVLHVLNMAELGIGSAMVFAMYKPIAQDDAPTICALMGLYRKYYRIVGLLIGIAGLLLTPVIPHLISGEVPADVNIYVLYVLNLGHTVLTYWLFAYKNCLLQAHHRNDIVSWITAGTYTLQCIVQLAVLVFSKNYYLYVVVFIASQVVNNIVTAVVVGKKYPAYKPVGKLPEEEVRSINQKIRDLFTAKIGSVILKSSDTIVISAFLGLTVLAVYQNYFFIVSSVLAIIEIVLSSMMAGLGNSYILETKEKNFQDLRKFSFLFLWIVGVCTCCFLGMYQPFMEIWVGKDLMLGMGEVICFAAYFFVYSLNRLLSVYKDAAGLWHEDRLRPLVTAMTNLCLNLLLVHFMGIYGVLLSTVVSMVFVGMPWIIQNLFTRFFEKTMRNQYVKQLLLHAAVTVCAGAIVCAVSIFLEGNPWLKLLVCAVASVVVSNGLFFLCLRKHSQFAPGIRFVDHLTRQKLGLEKRLLRE